MIDSHCHLNRLDLTPWGGSLDAMMAAAIEAGLTHTLNVSVELETVPDVIAIADKYPQVFASVGLHPSDVEGRVPTAKTLIELADHQKVIAIGETGLDYHYNDTGLEAMQESFRLHIDVAKQTNKPLIIHTRAAEADTLKIMAEESACDIGGVMHCFTERWEMAEVAMDMGFYISFSGIVTFKNAANVQSVAEKVPLERMLIETDAPYLTPVPYRGKPNAPHYVHYVAEKIAELKGVSYQTVIDATTENFWRCFRVSPY